MHHKTGGGLQGHAFGGRRRGVHKIQAGAFGRCLRRLQHIDIAGVLADFLQVAEGLLLDGGQAAGDIALGGLAVGSSPKSCGAR